VCDGIVREDQARQRFFKDLDGYVRAMSYGKYCLGGEVTRRWYALARPVSEYRISPRNLEVDKTRVRQLIEDVLDALVDYGFGALSLNRIFAYHMVQNPASTRVLERPGFSQEGLLRQRVRKWGTYGDVSIRAVLRSERHPLS
jgi:hypothetical protein